ncbi:MAG TPA: alkaline phosphatase D family protein [Candidatus Limnocylindrales bacterium]|nr:alkaline phosphatase D family protein [Candidatus Limnocylindrales bacterium]
MPTPESTPSSLPRFDFPDGEMETWAVLGHVSDRSVRVWGRSIGGALPVVVSVEGVEVATSEITPYADHDHVGVAEVELSSARPGAEFEVRVGDYIRRGRFAPEPGSPTEFSFAFGSCHQPFTEALDDGSIKRNPGAAIYPRIQALFNERGVDFAMWLGDQVYSDAVSEMSVREKLSKDPSVTDEALVETYRHLYRGFFNERGYRELSEATPSYLMWDDHDIFDGWGSLIDRSSFDERVYRAAEAAFREYQQLRNPGGTLQSTPPFGYSFWRGDVGFHVPDLRGERDFEKGQVMDRGWALLDAFLAEATDRGVPTLFICASVPVVHASPALMTALERLPTSSGRDVRDRWSVPTFAAERTKLLDRLFGWQSALPHRQVIVLSGDVHVGAAFNVKPRNGEGRFAQWTSSALSTPDGFKHIVANRMITKFVRLGERELRVWRRGLATSNNVGVVDVAPAPDGGHVVTLNVFEYDSSDDRMKLGLTDQASPSQSG